MDCELFSEREYHAIERTLGFCFGRPDCSYLEQYLSSMHRSPHRSFALCYVGSIPPQRRSHRLCLDGSDHPSLGYLWFAQRFSQLGRSWFVFHRRPRQLRSIWQFLNCQTCLGRPRSWRQLRAISPNFTPHHFCRWRSCDQNLAYERDQSLGGRCVPWSLQQRLKRAVPSEAWDDRLLWWR